MDLSPEEQASLVSAAYPDDPQMRHELRQLIQAERLSEEGFLDTPVGFLGEEDPRSAVPERAGPYRILEPLGSGGMGDVFLARRDDDAYEQLVAVKILRRGMTHPELVHRFRHERQILAGLDHPGIARLLDGGTTPDGRPFLVMEHVEGVTVDEYCRIHDLGVEDRLRIFEQICGAVQFAHQRLVVHRDLKPSNILVTAEGVPKLLDFGIAKLLDPEGLDLEAAYQGPKTATDLQPMTLQYASPEQLTGDALTTAADVYSLGILLYELLSGHRPYNVSRKEPGSAMRRICEEMPPRPSTVVGRADRFDLGAIGEPPDEDGRRLKRRLSGDLDVIVLKALAKKPAHRYSSVEQMAADVERHRTGRPIQARPQTWAYRTKKFVRRHRLAVGSTAAFISILLALLVVLWVQREEILRQQGRAEQVSSFLIELFRGSDPDEARGRTVTAEELLERGARRIDEELDDDPETRAVLLETMGVSFMHLGGFERAEQLLEESLALRRRGGEPSPSASLVPLAELRLWQGRYREAEELSRRAFEQLADELGPDHRRSLEARVLLARSLHLTGDRPRAEAAYLEALATAERGDRSDEKVFLTERYALFLAEEARFDEAESRFLEALAAAREHFGEPHRKVAQILNGYGVLLEEKGDFAGAEKQFRSARAMQERLFKSAHPELATTRHNLGSVLARQGRPEEAVQLLEQALDERRRLLGDEHPKVASTLGYLGNLYLELGRPEDAEPSLLESLRILRKALGDEHTDTAQALRRLAQLRVEQGRLDEAEATYGRVLDVQRRVLGKEHPEVGTTLNNLAEIALRRGDLDRAAELYQQALGILERTLDGDHGDLAILRYNLAGARHRQGRLEEAETGYRQALADAREAFGPEHLRVGQVATSLASLRFTAEDPAEAATLAREAVTILGARQPVPDAWYDVALRTLGRSLAATGRIEEARAVLEERLDRARASGDERRVEQAVQDRDELSSDSRGGG